MLILLGLFLDVLFMNVQAVPVNKNFNFENKYLYDDSLAGTSQYFNQRNQTSGNYLGTYDFRDEADGTTGTDISWITTQTGDDSSYSATVVAEEDGHRKVVKFLCAGDNGKYAQWYHNHVDQTADGTTIEKWFKYKDLGIGQFIIYFYGISGLQLVILSFRSSDNMFRYHYGNGAGGTSNSNVAATADTWHHVKMIFDFTNDNYDVYLNGVLLAADLPFIYDSVDTGIAYYQLRIDNFGGANSGECYLDAIGYSWDYEVLESYSLTSINITQGSLLSGVIANAELDDSNYFTLKSERIGTVDYITCYFDFDGVLPYQDAFLSYHIESSLSKSMYLRSNSPVEIDYAVVLDDDLISINYLDLVSEITEIYLTGTHTVFPYLTVKVYYLNLTLVNYGYKIGDNLKFPEMISTNITEIDKYEFYTDESGNVITQVNQIADWNNESTCLSIFDENIDNSIQFSVPYGLTKTDNLTLDFNAGAMDYIQVNATIRPIADKWAIIMFNFYNSTGIKLSIAFDFQLWVVSGIYFYEKLVISHSKTSNNIAINPSSYSQLYSEWIPNWVGVNQTFYLQMLGSKVLFTYSEKEYDLEIQKGAFTQAEIKFYGYSDKSKIYLDTYGIIVNGISLCNETSSVIYNIYNLDISSWNFLRYNFIQFTFNMTHLNDINITLSDDTILFESSDIIGNDIVFSNLYQSKLLSNPYLIITNESTYHILNLKIYGIVMKDDSNTYYPIFDFTNINVNDSYFHVSGSNLHYKLVSDDDNTESINIRFFITMFTSTDYLFSMSHQCTNLDFTSQLIIKYISLRTTTFTSSLIIKNENTIINQDETVFTFDFVITDNDEQNSGYTEGYFSSLTFTYFQNYELTLLTDALFTIFPAILMMILPPIIIQLELIYDKRKKGKDLDNPIVFNVLLLLFSLIPIISGVLPNWFFFIMLFSIFTAITVGGKYNDNDN